MNLKSLAAFLIGLFCVSAVSAATILEADFTDAEAFKQGRLDRQAGFSVKKKVLVKPDVGATYDGFELAVNNGTGDAAVVAPDETYSVSMTFSFTDKSEGKKSGAGVMGGPALFVEDANPSGESISVIFTRTGNEYRFRPAENSFGNKNIRIDGKSTFAQSRTVREDKIGIDFAGGDIESDELTVTLSLTAGDDADSWVYHATLTNATTEKELLSYKLRNVSFGVAAGAKVFGGFVGGQADNVAGVEGRTVKKLVFSSSVEE